MGNILQKQNFVIGNILLWLTLLLSSQLSAQCLLIPIPLDERVQKSSHVFEGEIIQSEGFLNPSKKMIHTAFKVRVTRVFKGEIREPFVVVYTEGGRFGNSGLVVNPSLDLMVGDKGVFIASSSDMPTPYIDLDTYYPFGTANGFIRYDLILNSASEAFYKYKDIQADLYPKLESLSRKKSEFIAKLSGPQIKGTNATDRAMIPNNITFTPTTITAGTFTQLTINGNDFGPGGGASEVRFRNADDGGGTTVNIPSANPHIISWTNTQIVVMVPQRAGTGTVQVVDNAGLIGTSAGTLTVSYAIINAGSPGVARHQVLTDRNFAGGHTLSLNTTTGFAGNAPAVDAFRRALETWRCATRVNYPISAVTTTADYTNTADTINSVCFDGPTTITALGICFSAWTFPVGCVIPPGGGTGIKTTFDLVFRHPTTNPPPQPWSFTVVPPMGINWYDFQSVATHEIGHAHELAHVIDPAFEVMNFNIANGQTRRNIAGGATNAGNFVMTRSTNVGQMLGCNVFPHQAIDPATCSQTTPPLASCGITASITSGCSPLTVNFTGDIPVPTNIPSSWMWNINFNGDGSPPGPPSRPQIEYYTRNVTHTFTAPGTYVVKVYAGSAANNTNSYCSSTITINVTGTFVANITPINPAPACGSILLTATNDINFSYQWRRNGVDILGATNNTFTATQSGTYDVRITQGACSQIVGPTTVTISPNSVGGNLSGGGAVCANGNSGTMTLTGFVGNILRWEMSTDNFVTVTNIPNTTPAQNYNNIVVPTQYRVVVQSPGCPPEFSTVASFTVNPPTIPGTIAPANVSGCSGSINGSLTLSGHQGNILRWEASTNGFGTIQNIPNSSPNQSYSGLTQTTQYRAVVQNPGCAVLFSNVVTINVSQTPNSLGNITGPTVICQNVVGNYTVTMTPNVIYDWSVSPAGPVLIPAGNSVQVNYSNAPQGNYVLTVTPRNGVCEGPPSTLNVFVQAVPVTPSQIHAPAQCIGQTGFYYVDPVAGASSYTWTNSCGWIGTSNSSFISLLATNNQPCTITVQAFGTCGQTGVVSVNVTPIDIPNLPSTISGNPSVCPERLETYSVINTQGVTYTWSGIPQGAFIANGQGTNQVDINWGQAAAGTYTLTVTPSNPCGNGQVQTLNVNVIGIPAQPSPILGVPNVCQNSPQTYAVNFTSGVNYVWNVIPSGPTLIPSNNTVAFNSAMSGTYLLSVTQNSVCGASPPQFFTVIVEAQRVANAGVNRTVCSPNTILVGSPSGGQWNCVTCPGVNLTPAGNYGIVSGMRPNSVNIFRYAFAPSGACPGSEAFVTITNGVASAGSISGPNSVCAGGNITLNLTGNQGNVIRWEVSEDNGVSFIGLNNTTNTLTYNITTNAQFRVVAGTGACPNVFSAPYPVIVNQQVQAQVDQVNVTVCSDNVNIFALNPTQNAEGIWSFVSGPVTANVTSTGVMGLVTGMTQAGTYRFRWTIDNAPPCTPTTAETFVTRLQPTTQANAGNDQTICADNVTLTGNIPQSGTARWMLLSGPNTPIITGNTTIQVTGMIPGRYVFDYQINNPPCPSTQDQVIITVIGGTQTANAGPDQTVCSATGTVVGSDPAPGTGSWSFLSGPSTAIITTNGRTGSISGMTQPGDYFFLWTVNSPQCGNSTDIVMLTRLPGGGIAQVNQSLISVCGQSGTTLAAVPFGNGTGNWSFVSGPSVATITTNGLDGVVSGMNLSGVYLFRWTVTSSCGTSTADVTVRKDNTVPQAYAGANQSVCDAQSALVNGNQVPQGATGVWAFVSGPAPASITTFGTFGSIAGMTLPGTYLFSWTIRSNTSCPNSSSIVSITRVARPTLAQAPSNQTVCGTSAIITGNTPIHGTGMWTFVSGPQTPGLSQQGTTASISGMNLAGTYRFRWTISNPPCASSASEVTITTTPASVAGNLSGGGQVCGGNNNGTLVLSGYQGAIVRWEMSTNNFVSFNPIQNNSPNQSFFNLTQTTFFRAVVKNGTCAEAVSNIVTINVTPSTPPADAGADQTICSNNLTLSGNAVQSGTAVWEFQAGPVSPSVQSLNNVAIITGMNFSGDYYFRYRINNPPCGSSEDVVKITVSAPTVAGNVSANQTFCSNNNTALFTLTGHLGQVVRWESSTNNFGTVQNIANTTNSLRVDNVSQNTQYRAVVKNGICNEVVTNPVSVTILNSIQANAGTDQTICGSSVVLNGNDPQNGTPTWSYVSGPNQPSINQNGFSANVTGLVSGTYQFKYTINVAGCPPSSDLVQVIVSAPSQGGQIAGGTSVCSGNNTGTVVVTGFVGNVIRWERSTNGWQTAEVLNNATPQHTYINVTQTTQYRAVIASGVCGQVVSSDVTVYVNENPTQANAGQSQTVCTGASVTLTGNQPQFGTPNWRFLSGPITPNLVPSGNMLTVNGLNTIGTYAFEYSISNAPCNASVSNVTITVAGSPVAGTASGTTTVCAGTNNGAVTLTNQTGNILRWESSTDNFGQNITPIANSTNVLGYINLNTTTSFRAVVSRPGCPEVMSNAVTITVAQPSVGGILQGTQNVCLGNNVGVLTLTGHVGNVIRWEISTNNFQSFSFILANGNTFPYNNLTQTTQVRAVVKSGTCAEATSSIAVLTVDPVSVGGNLNGSATVCHGQNSGNLSLTGQVGNILRWESSTDNWVTVNTINNTNPTLAYANLTQTTGFRVVVKSGVCPEVNSSVAVVLMNPQSLPGILAGGTTVCGFLNSVNLNLSGNAGTIVRWESSTNNFQTVTPINNTGNTLTVNNLNQTTRYRVVVQPSGNCPQTISNGVEITVLPAVQSGGVSGPLAVCAPVNNGVLTLGGFMGNVLRWESSTDNFQTVTQIPNNGNVYTFVNLLQTTSFRAIVTNGNCPPTPSQSWTVQVGTGTLPGVIQGARGSCGVAAQGTLTLTGFSGNVLRWESSEDNWLTVTTIQNSSPNLTYDVIFTTQFRAVVQSPGCATVTTAPVTVTVDQLPSAGALYNDATVCYEQNGGSLYLIGTIGRILRWESSTDNFVTVIPIPNTLSYLNYTGLTETTKYRAVANTGGVCEDAYSNEVTIFVRPQITVTTSVAIGCNGMGSIIARAQGGGGEYTYNIFPTVQPANTSGEFNNLQPNVYTLTVVDGFNCSLTVTVNVTGNPTAPQISTVSNVTTSSAIVAWQPVPPINGVTYTLRYRILGSNTWTVINNLSATQFFFTGLQNNTTYEVQLAYRCSANAPLSEFSTGTVNRFTTLSGGDCASQVVPTPGGLFVNNITANTAQVNWNTVQGAAGYIVSFGLASQNPSLWQQLFVCNPMNMIQLNSLQPNTIYRARVRTNCTQCGINQIDRMSAWSLNVEFITPTIRESLDAMETLKLTVYPNPNKGNFTIAGGTGEAFLYDGLGRLVWSGQLNAEAKEVNGLSAGLYTLKVEGSYHKIWVEE